MNNFREIVNSQQYYYKREQAKNFNATRIRVPQQPTIKQQPAHCGTLQCTNKLGIKTIHVRNINDKAVMMNLCRGCRARPVFFSIPKFVNCSDDGSSKVRYYY